MSITDGGKSHGCTTAWQNRSYGIQNALRILCDRLDPDSEGGVLSLPTTYTIAGEVFNVTGLTTMTADDGSTNNFTTLNNKLNASRGGTPTLVVIQPDSADYGYSGEVTLATNTYVGGYGVNMLATTLRDVRWSYNSNCGVFGIRFEPQEGAITRWPERREAAGFTAPGSKDGSVADAGTSDDSDAWLYSGGNSNIVAMDCQFLGSLSGAMRFHSNTNVLVEGNHFARTHSDGLHIGKASANITIRRNSGFQAGDDAIALIQYIGVGGRPSNYLVEQNFIMGGRARGYTTVSTKDCLFRRMYAEQVGQAPYRFGPTSSHSDAAGHLQFGNKFKIYP